MRTLRFIVVLSILIFSFAVLASAQRTRRPAPRATPKPTPAKPTVNPVVAAAKQQVSNQLFNVNVFVDKMGPIAVIIENSDKDAAARRLKSDQIAANDRNKKGVITAIRGLRDALVALESDFRTKPQLAQYLPTIQGISTLCAQSEDNAIAGRFVAAKDPLRQIALKLNDTLAVLPGPLAGGGVTTPVRTTPVSTSQNRPVSTATQNTATSRRDPALGMTSAEVLQSAWGAPSNKRNSSTANGATEVWSYSGNRTIYFFNGKVSQIVR
jgi:hypothetical protein